MSQGLRYSGQDLNFSVYHPEPWCLSLLQVVEIEYDRPESGSVAKTVSAEHLWQFLPSSLRSSDGWLWVFLLWCYTNGSTIRLTRGWMIWCLYLDLLTTTLLHTLSGIRLEPCGALNWLHRAFCVFTGLSVSSLFNYAVEMIGTTSFCIIS